jgi:hypothetical protein
MPQDNDTKAKSDIKTHNSQEQSKRSRARLWIAVGSVVLVLVSVGLAVVAIYFVNEHSARIKFATESVLSLLVLTVIIVQACIYFGQRTLMQLQWKAVDRQTHLMDDQKKIMGAQGKIMSSQAHIMIESLNDTRKLIAQNERFSRIDSRAYLFVFEATLESPINSGQFPLAKIVLRNSGKTPAFQHRIRIEQSFFAGEDLEKARKGIMPAMRPMSDKGTGIIGPGSYSTLHLDRQRWGRPEDKELAIKGDIEFYVWGLICYCDIFGKQHSSKFSLYARNPRVKTLSFGLFGNDFEDEETKDAAENQEK